MKGSSDNLLPVWGCWNGCVGHVAAILPMGNDETKTIGKD